MRIQEFIVKAGLPSNWKELDLQEFIGQNLYSRGCKVHYEVKANGGYADIVSDWLGGSIIEVKKILTRDAIYQATGQLNLYSLNKPQFQLVVMGLLPDTNQEAAITTASMICQDKRFRVIFLNQSSEWLGKTQGGINIPTIPIIKLGWEFLTGKIDFNFNRTLFNVVLKHPVKIIFVIAFVICFYVEHNYKNSHNKNNLRDLVEQVGNPI